MADTCIRCGGRGIAQFATSEGRCPVCKGLGNYTKGRRPPPNDHHGVWLNVELDPTVLEDEMAEKEAPDEIVEAALSLPIKDAPITMRTLDVLRKTPTVPVRYRESETGVQDMFAAVLVGREIGIEPMEAINSLYLVNGQISMSGKLMSALVHRAGHQIRVDIETKGATATAWRRDYVTHELTEVGSFQFTEADAKKAGLADKATYTQYPKTMLAWRAIAALCRIYFADVISGMAAYVPEELNVLDPELPEVEVLDDAIDVMVDGESLEMESATAVVVDELDAEVVVEVPPPAKKKAKK